MLVYALAFIPAVGLPIVAFLNGWLTCYKKDAAHLPFHRRVTPTGYVLLSAVVVLASFNLVFLYQGQIKTGVRADRLEKQLADAQSALASLQAETVRAFTDDLRVRSWHQWVSNASNLIYIKQQSEAMKIGGIVPGLKASESLTRRFGNSKELPSGIRDLHERFYESQKKSLSLINRARMDYVPVLRLAGIEEANLQEVLADWHPVPEMSTELERSQREFGPDPDFAQADADFLTRFIDLNHECMQAFIEVEHSRRLALVRPPANPLSKP